MKKQYTKKQITEAIAHWQSVLKKIDESENELLNALFSTFGADDLLNDTNAKITSEVLEKCFDTLNMYFFSSSLSKIPIIYKSDNELRQFLMSRDMKSSDIPKIFFGTYSVLYDNDPLTLKWNDTLILHDDVILLNSSHIDKRSFAFLTSCLCHEMIHYYDRLFGEYCDFIKYTLMTNDKKDRHNTMTFETMREHANDLGINVIQQIPKNKNADILDKEAIDLLFKQAQENGLVLEDEKRIISSIDGITFSKNKCGGSINTF